jgi:hypothetical protein
MNGIYTPDFKPYAWGGTEWIHVFYDWSLNSAMLYEIYRLVGSTSAAVSEAVGEPIQVIYPMQIEHKTIFEGVVRGNIVILLGASGGTAVLDTIEVTIKAMDASGLTRELASCSMGTTFSTSSSAEKALPFFFDIDAKKGHAERIIAEYVLYAHATGGGTATLKLSSTINQNDLYLDLPAVT